MLDRPQRDQLIQDNLGYVRALAAQVKKQLSPQLDFDELVAFGSKGLVEAAERFDASRGVAFTTFAYYRIRGAIYDGLRQMGWLNRTEYGRFVSAANDYLENQAEREAAAPPAANPPSTEQTVAELGAACSELAAIYVTSLAACPGEDPADEASPTPSDRLEAQQASVAVRAALAHLPEKERRLVQLYYFEERTLEQAGRELGLSKSWACRLHARAVQILSQHLAL